MPSNARLNPLHAGWITPLPDVANRLRSNGRASGLIFHRFQWGKMLGDLASGLA